MLSCEPCMSIYRSKSVADPGFPIGGCGPIGEGGPLTRAFLVKMYVKMKELGPVGGMHPAHSPISANQNNL